MPASLSPSGREEESGSKHEREKGYVGAHVSVGTGFENISVKHTKDL